MSDTVDVFMKQIEELQNKHNKIVRKSNDRAMAEASRLYNALSDEDKLEVQKRNHEALAEMQKMASLSRIVGLSGKPLTIH